MVEEEIKKELQPQWIFAVERISIGYNLYVLTIKGQNIPQKANIGYLNKETRPYITKPQRCFQCQKFEHTKNSCKGKAVCAGCGGEGHNLDDCQNDLKCVNCQSDHVAISRDCPKWKNWERHCDPQIYRKDFICRRSQTFTTIFRPIKGFICNCNTDPSSIFETSSTLGQRNPTSNWL